MSWCVGWGITKSLPTFPSWFGQQRGFPAAAALTDSRTLQASGREHSDSLWSTWVKTFSLILLFTPYASMLHNFSIKNVFIDFFLYLIINDMTQAWCHVLISSSSFVDFILPMTHTLFHHLKTLNSIYLVRLFDRFLVLIALLLDWLAYQIAPFTTKLLV